MQMTEKIELTGFEFQSLNFEKAKKPLPFELWEVKRELEIQDVANDPRTKHFRHDLAAVPVENFSMSDVHYNEAESRGDPMILPKVYMIELKPESGAAYVEEHDMWIPDNTRFFKILRDGGVQQIQFGLLAHMFKTMHR